MGLAANLRTWLGPFARRRRGGVDAGLDPDDLADLESIGQELVHEYPGTAPEVIAVTARRLIARGVPLRAVRDARSGPGVGQLCFADGTVLTVGGAAPGCLGRVAVKALQGRARLDGCEVRGTQVRLAVGWGRHTEALRALAVGWPA